MFLLFFLLFHLLSYYDNPHKLFFLLNEKGITCKMGSGRFYEIVTNSEGKFEVRFLTLFISSFLSIYIAYYDCYLLMKFDMMLFY